MCRALLPDQVSHLRVFGAPLGYEPRLELGDRRIGRMLSREEWMNQIADHVLRRRRKEETIAPLPPTLSERLIAWWHGINPWMFHVEHTR